MVTMWRTGRPRNHFKGRLFLFQSDETYSGVHWTSSRVAPMAISPPVKWLEREAAHSPPSCVEIKNHVVLRLLCLWSVWRGGSCNLYRVSQEECARLRESVPYVKVYRHNPKHLYPKLNGYGDKGRRKVGASCDSKYCNLHSWYVTWQC